jgi:type II secretory ATPase GspE/PulE/Tfp pilus assembly ATPase PilB-like protein
MVRFLARELDISEEAAGKLFDDLRRDGVILRGDEPVSESDLPDRDGQSWRICAEHANNNAAVRLNSAILAGRPDETEPQALDLLRRAISQRATDVHLDPYGDEIELRFRIDGRLEHYCRLSEQIGEKLMTQLKILANLDPSEPFRAQEGRLDLPVSLSDYDVRVTSTPVVAGAAVALRLLRRDQIIRPLDTLGFSEESFVKIDELLKMGEGMVLVSGPSGSGKTTTLYSLVKALDDGHRNIVTIEDPVEYLVPEFLQLQVDPKHDRTLESEVKTVLRMDPDIILVGEIRDGETARAAMQAASCGKYIFCSFHTRDSASVVTRLRDLKVDDRSLASNLRAVISQRLIRRPCEQCRDTRPITDDEVALFDAEGITLPESLPLCVGCEACHQRGYHERIGVFEIGIITPDLAEAIENGQTERQLRHLLRSDGVKSLMADGLQKVRNGITTLQEVRSMSCLFAEERLSRSGSDVPN